MSTYSMFLNIQETASPTRTLDPFFTAYLDQFNTDFRFNIKAKYAQSIALDDGDSKALSFNAASTDWVIFLFRVVGTASFTAVAKDSDNTTNITGIFPTYGTDKLPGYIIWSTQRYVSGASISATEDGTEVEALIVIAEEDA